MYDLNYFKITEILSKFITIDNNNPTIEDVENKYKNQEIVLLESDDQGNFIAHWDKIFK